MVDDLLVARNPEPGSSLPYLIRVPLGPAGIVVKDAAHGEDGALRNLRPVRRTRTGG